ncbi:hypothetical protein BN1012_Phect1330 [Candidatus Phaeomarinobacter ectocarpi]|uniref:Uncharacterized protein n=1 Tax=Candidatus Phaeomarinibacter ectocarpi TaxID=1458461 RepID=X5MEZ1_9HYPH|nr:hypothetical protein BN1012_Phect1330 [Candidatus Phaeomarinobacter ectocarpi]
MYSSREAAEAAKTRLLLQPGFKDHPDGFMIDTPEIDKDQWTEGFITVLHGDE